VLDTSRYDEAPQDFYSIPHQEKTVQSINDHMIAHQGYKANIHSMIVI